MKYRAPRILAVVALAVGVIFGTHQAASPAHHGSHVVVPPGQPAPRVGPSYLYPDPETTPGVKNPDITQANIHENICNPNWHGINPWTHTDERGTKSVRPPASYTDNLKKQQLAAPRYKDKTPSHYEEDHLISLELGGHPRNPQNLWPEMWGTPDQPLTHLGPFPPSIVGAKSKDKVEDALKAAVCAGTMTLQEAQHIIATDWFQYYRDHVLK